MKRLVLATLATCACIAALAVGQPVATRLPASQLQVLGERGLVAAMPVKGAPYSGEEVTVFDQTLGDGTKIHTENHTKVYRDSEGRLRRDSENSGTIYDPIAGVSYVLDPKTMTARKMPYTVVARKSGDGSVTVTSSLGTAAAGPKGATGFVTNMETYTVSGSSSLSPTTAAEADAAKLAASKLAKAELERLTVGGTAGSMSVGPVMRKMLGQTESLGQQMMEGVPVEGTRTTSTIEAGSIGNDRAINVSSETWYSQDLHTMVMSRHTDPRSGEESFRLINVNRNNPDPMLFQLPAGYTVVEPRTAAPAMIKRDQ